MPSTRPCSANTTSGGSWIRTSPNRCLAVLAAHWEPSSLVTANRVRSLSGAMSASHRNGTPPHSSRGCATPVPASLMSDRCQRPSSTTPSTPSTPMVAGASPPVTTRRSSTGSKRASVRPACPTASHCVRQISRTCSVLRREAPSAKPALVPTTTMMSWTTMCATSPHRSSWPAP